MISDHVDRRSGKCIDERRRTSQKANGRQQAIRGEIDSQTRAEEGASQHDNHMSSTEHGRSHRKGCQTQTRGEVSAKSAGQPHQWHAGEREDSRRNGNSSCMSGGGESLNRSVVSMVHQWRTRHRRLHNRAHNS